MSLVIHPNALKHLSREQLLAAWDCVTESIRRESDDEPPRWLCVGWLPNRGLVGLIVVETTAGWMLIHAMNPIQKRFAEEIGKARRGS